jgi:hypothetical protein
MWDPHYLKHHPVHDLSLEMKVRYSNWETSSSKDKQAANVFYYSLT